MNKKAAQLFVIALLVLVGAVLAYAVLSANDERPQSDEEFLASLRDSDESGPSTPPSESLLPAAGSENRPDIALETHMFSLGTVPHDKITTAEVMIYNRGTAPLEIMKVTTSCGCTTGKMSKDIIPPGGEAPLIITFNPSKIPNQFNSLKTLTIRSNDPTKMQAALNVRASVDPEIYWSPSTADLGVIAKGEGFALPIRLTQNTKQPFEVLNVLIPNAGDTVHVEWAEVPESEWATPGKREYIVTASVPPDAPVGEFRSTVEISTNIERASRLSIPLNANVRGPYNLRPTAVRLRDIQPGDSFEEIMTLTSKSAIEVKSVTTSNALFQVAHRAGETPNAVVFDLNVGTPSEPGIQRDSWQLSLSVDGKPYAEVIDVVATLLEAAD